MGGLYDDEEGDGGGGDYYNDERSASSNAQGTAQSSTVPIKPTPTPPAPTASSFARGRVLPKAMITTTSSSSSGGELKHSLTKVGMLQGQKMLLHDMQLRENLIVYNMIVQRCFQDCVSSFHTLHLATEESDCITRCADKHIHHSERVGRKFADAAGAQFLHEQQVEKENLIRANKDMDKLKDNDLL